MMRTVCVTLMIVNEAEITGPITDVDPSAFELLCVEFRSP